YRRHSGALRECRSAGRGPGDTGPAASRSLHPERAVHPDPAASDSGHAHGPGWADAAASDHPHAVYADDPHGSGHPLYAIL
ncbi:MAG TPA: hypothetical protein VMG58_11040, partial [Candidatus Sulfotelmatobacter sp.]|nr:hypothetical protein [Candidatus Sulfotelmatobacter sp.]